MADQLRGSLRRLTLTTMGAQAVALLSLSLASIFVARTTTAALVGEYALLRVLPWLLAVTCSAGLPVSSAYFMAGPTRRDPRLRSTICAIAVAGGVVGAAVWLAAMVFLRRLYFPSLGPRLAATAALLVLTQLFTVTAKACCQGSGDIPGANLLIVAEELLFLPWYVGAWLSGRADAGGILAALIGAGVCATALGAARLRGSGFFRQWGRPSRSLARAVASYGVRGQVGNVLWLLNLRLDFLILGAIAGPVTLGVYAVASKFAELMRLGPTAINYVLYPRFTRLSPWDGVREARRLLPRVTLLVAAAVPFVVVSAVIALPLLYGPAFRSAVLPACVIILGLTPEGAAAVSSALLWGLGRPGTNSLGMAGGLVVTVGLDLLLIPRHGTMGAAVASAAAYLTTTVVLVAAAARAARQVESRPCPEGASSTFSPAAVHVESVL